MLFFSRSRRTSYLRGRRGFTIIELVIVIVVTAILASAFVGVMVPMINFYFYYPQSTRAGNAAVDLLQIILEGDAKAKGLRYTGPACTIGGAGGGGSMITAATSSGTTSTLTYNYADHDYCGSGAARISHTVTLVYDSSLGTVTRSIDGGAAANIPDYVTNNSDIKFNAPGGGTDLFHYFDLDGNDLGSQPLTANIIYEKNVGTNISNKTNGTTLSVTVPAAGVAKDHLLVVSFTVDGVSGTISTADVKNNSYSVAADAIYASPGTGNVRTVILYAMVSNPLVSGDTITVTHPSRAARAMSVDEYSGVNTLDVVATGVGSTTTPSTATVTTNSDNELLVAAFGVEGPPTETFTPGSGYSASPPPEDGTTGGGSASNVTINPEYRIVSSIGSYNASATLSVNTDSARALATFFSATIHRVDIDVIAVQGSGQVQYNSGQIRLKTGVEIKEYNS